MFDSPEISWLLRLKISFIYAVFCTFESTPVNQNIAKMKLSQVCYLSEELDFLLRMTGAFFKFTDKIPYMVVYKVYHL